MRRHLGPISLCAVALFFAGPAAFACSEFGATIARCQMEQMQLSMDMSACAAVDVIGDDCCDIQAEQVPAQGRRAAGGGPLAVAEWSHLEVSLATVAPGRSAAR